MHGKKDCTPSQEFRSKRQHFSVVLILLRCMYSPFYAKLEVFINTWSPENQSSETTGYFILIALIGLKIALLAIFLRFFKFLMYLKVY